MRHILQTISALALLGTILPSILYFLGRIELESCKYAMMIATIIWFAVTPFWMGRNQKAPEGFEL